MCFGYRNRYSDWEGPVARGDWERPVARQQPPNLRVSDADRERVAERLRTHAADGRLTPEELEERLERTYAARTHADLQPVLADLPEEEPAAPPRRARAPRPDLRVFAVVAFVLVALWALTGAGYFWPVWPLGFWALGVLKHPGARRRRQPRGQWV